MDWEDSIVSNAQIAYSLCRAPMTFSGSIATIVTLCLIGILWAVYNYNLVK